MDPLECKSASIGSTSPEGLGIMGPKSSTTSMPSKAGYVRLVVVFLLCPKHHCLLARLVDMPVDIPSSTSWAEATTIVPIKGSMPLLWLQHLTTSLCWQACSTITDQQWLWYIRCCSIQANHLSQPWRLSFSMMTTTRTWKHDKQVVISSVGGSCWYMLEGGLWGYDTEPMMCWQAWHSNWNKCLLQKIGYTNAGWIGALLMLRCHTILAYVWCIHLNGICWNPYLNTMQIFETWLPARMTCIPSCSHKTKCIVHQSNNNMSANSRPTAFQFDTFLTALQNVIGQGGKSDVRLAGKALCLGEAKQKGAVPATK